MSADRDLAARLRGRVRQHEEFRQHRVSVDFGDLDSDRERLAADRLDVLADLLDAIGERNTRDPQRALSSLLEDERYSRSDGGLALERILRVLIAAEDGER